MLTNTQTPLLSYEAIQKAARIIKYVYKFYFPLHSLNSEDICTYYPILTSVEATIYQADLIMEKGQNTNIAYTPDDDKSNYITILKNSLINFLEDKKFLDSTIANELANGEKFIKLENKIMVDGVITHSDIMRVAELRSSDVRLLHLILFRLLGKPYDEKLLSLIWPVEVIADIEDDFSSYADDVAQKHYNTYRMFVSLYKECAPEYIRTELNFYENLFKERLAAFPDDERLNLRKLYYQFRQANFSAIPEPILN